MKSLITGSVVFVLWSFFSVWLYANKLQPAMNKDKTTQLIPIQPDVVNDSELKAESTPQPDLSKPENLLIYFSFNDAEFSVSKETENSIKKFKSWIDNNPESVIIITGHTDNIGSTQYNRQLGFKRAQSVQNYFQKNGVGASNLQVNSLGEAQPASEQSTENGRAKNRRVEVILKN